MYRLRHDTDTNVLEIETEGFWDIATVTAFGVAAVAKGAAIRLRHGNYAIFADARAMPTQSGAVAGAVAMLLPKARLLTNGPIVLLGASMLNKLQMDRVLSGDRIRSFIDHGEARRWLAAEWTTKRAA